eukprot:RCo008282
MSSRRSRLISKGSRLYQDLPPPSSWAGDERPPPSYDSIANDPSPIIVEDGPIPDKPPPAYEDVVGSSSGGALPTAPPFRNDPAVEPPLPPAEPPLPPLPTYEMVVGSTPTPEAEDLAGLPPPPSYDELFQDSSSAKPAPVPATKRRSGLTPFVPPSYESVTAPLAARPAVPPSYDQVLAEHLASRKRSQKKTSPSPREGHREEPSRRRRRGTSRSSERKAGAAASRPKRRFITMAEEAVAEEDQQQQEAIEKRRSTSRSRSRSRAAGKAPDRVPPPPYVEPALVPFEPVAKRPESSSSNMVVDSLDGSKLRPFSCDDPSVKP